MFTMASFVQQERERHDIQERRNTSQKRGKRNSKKKNKKKNPRITREQRATSTGRRMRVVFNRCLWEKNGTNRLFDVNYLEENCTVRL